MTTSKKLLLDEKRFVLEAGLTKLVKEWLDLQPDIYFYKASDRYQSGISDIIACVGGVFCAIELKAEYNEMSPQQHLFIRNVTAVNGVAGDAYTLGEVKALVNKARELAKKLSG